MPKILFRNCLGDDLLAGPVSAASAKAGGAPVVAPRHSTWVDVAEEVEGDEAEAEETVKGTFRVCMITEPLKVGPALHHGARHLLK